MRYGLVRRWVTVAAAMLLAVRPAPVTAQQDVTLPVTAEQLHHILCLANTITEAVTGGDADSLRPLLVVDTVVLGPLPATPPSCPDMQGPLPQFVRQLLYLRPEAAMSFYGPDAANGVVRVRLQLNTPPGNHPSKRSLG